MNACTTQTTIGTMNNVARQRTTCPTGDGHTQTQKNTHNWKRKHNSFQFADRRAAAFIRLIGCGIGYEWMHWPMRWMPKRAAFPISIFLCRIIRNGRILIITIRILHGSWCSLLFAFHLRARSHSNEMPGAGALSEVQRQSSTKIFRGRRMLFAVPVP